MKENIRRKEILKYSFYFAMFVLGITNTVFLIYNWNDWTPQLNSESVLLSVVGFFFAFAGINLYSIFNTNIENEKEALRNLAKRYDGELNLSSRMLQFPQEMIMIWNTCQYVATSSAIHRNSFSWLTELRSRLKSQRDFVQDLKDHYRTSQYERYRSDLTNLAMGVKSSLQQHKERIEKDKTFFKPLPSNEGNYMGQLNSLIKFVKELSEYEYEIEPEVNNKGFCEKVRDVAGYVRKTFWTK